MRILRPHRISKAIFLPALLSSFTVPRVSAQLESHREVIDSLYREWVVVTNAKDLGRWTAFLAPEPLFLPPNHPALSGQNAIRVYYARSFADDHFSLRCRQDRVEVAASEDMAWSTGICEATFTGPDGVPTRGSSKWAKVWIRMPDGSWKCALNSWSMNGPSKDHQ